MTKSKSIFDKFKAIVIFSGLILLFAIGVGLYMIITLQNGQEQSSSLLLISCIVFAVIFVVFIIVATIFMSRLKKKSIKPLDEVLKSLERINSGNPTAPGDYHSDDEIGRIAELQRSLCERMSFDIHLFEHMKNGDFSHDLVPSSEGDGLVFSIQAVIENQRMLIRNMREVSSEIMAASSHIATGSYNLAEGSNEQSSAIAEFAVTIKDLQKAAVLNAEMAEEVINSIVKYTAIIEGINDDMGKMAETMNDIIESAHSISSVSDVIENIAFQTNILALNAAVEAARAGQHGKGFAVVADEVRELSTKSAEAARKTSELIGVGLRNVETGSKIVENAASGMAKISQLSSGNMERVKMLDRSIAEQRNSVGEISRTIDQIAGIVHANSALAEEASAAATGLADQAQQLDSLSDAYRIE